MATTAPQLTAVRRQRTPCTRQPARRQAAALRELAVARPYGFVQAKLTVGPANDRFEQEADAVADRVMRMENPKASRAAGDIEGGCPGCQAADKAAAGQPLLQRKPIEAEDMSDSAPPPLRSEQSGMDQNESLPEEFFVQRSAASPSASGIPVMAPYANALQGAIASGGQALAPGARAFMEPRFGQDFSTVRVHSDGKAANLARQIDARAFTLGRDIFFGAGEYAPAAQDGRRLLAHELTHVVQQSEGGGSLQLRRTPCSAYPGYNPSFDRTKYNCAGLATRTYANIPTANATYNSMAQEFTQLTCPTGNCDPSQIKFWLWEYMLRFEDDRGVVLQAASEDFHIVAGRMDSDGKEPTNIYSKNGKRPIHGPGTGASFKPAAHEPALDNDDNPTQTSDGRPVYKVRTNMSEMISCGNCR
jgi:hypothetical protein